MIEQRTVCVNIGLTMIHIATQRGLPQGGGLSPTLWSMVADSLLILLNRQGTRSLCSGLCQRWSSDNYRESPEHFMQDYACNEYFAMWKVGVLIEIYQ